MDNGEVELVDIFHPPGELTLGFLEVEQPGQGAMVSPYDERLPQQVVAELFEEYHNRKELSASHTVALLLLVEFF